MNTEYRIRIENNEIVITTRSSGHTQQASSGTTNTQKDEHHSLPSSYPGEKNLGKDEGGGEGDQSDTGGGGPVPGSGLIVIFGPVSFCCGRGDLGGGEADQTDTGGGKKNR